MYFFSLYTNYKSSQMIAPIAPNTLLAGPPVIIAKAQPNTILATSNIILLQI